MLKRTLPLFLLLCSPVLAEPLRLTILHTNDIHSHDEPYRERGRNIGGMARISTLLKQLHSEGGNQITLDAGDIFQGSPFYQFYHGEVEVELLNRAGYDIGTIGNHEFDDGPVNLARQLKRARYQLINCNLDTGGYPELSACYVPSAVREFGGEKVGFIGAITPDLEILANHLEGVKVQREKGDWLVPLRREVERLQAQGIDKIVLLTHCGVNWDEEIARGIPAVDVVIGGHSHTRLEEPIDIPHPDGSHTLIVQADCYTRCVGKFQVAFDAQGRVDVPSCQYQLLDVTDKIPQDPQITAYLEEKGKPLAARLEPLGSEAATHFEDKFGDLYWDSPLGDLVTDAYADFAAQYGATIALHNRGGLRSRIEAGPLTRGQLEAVLPFDNKLVIAEVTGAQLKKVLEHSLAAEPGSRFFDVHGLQIGYKPQSPEGHKLTFARVLTPKGKWEALRPQGRYRVAVNDYNFGGGEGYDFGKSPVIASTGKRLSEFFIRYARSHPKLSVVSPARIAPLQPLSEPPAADASLTLFAGEGPGVTPWQGVPVPLAQAKAVSGNARESVRQWRALVARSGKQVKIWLLPPGTHL